MSYGGGFGSTRTNYYADSFNTGGGGFPSWESASRYRASDVDTGYGGRRGMDVFSGNLDPRSLLQQQQQQQQQLSQFNIGQSSNPYGSRYAGEFDSLTSSSLFGTGRGGGGGGSARNGNPYDNRSRLNDLMANSAGEYFREMPSQRQQNNMYNDSVWMNRDGGGGGLRGSNASAFANDQMSYGKYSGGGGSNNNRRVDRYEEGDRGAFGGRRPPVEPRPPAFSFRDERTGRGGFFRPGPMQRGRDQQYGSKVSSDKQKSGAGKIWYTGPRCSLIKDSDSGEQIFMYNTSIQPPGIRLKDNMEVLYGAFYDKKYIKKHKLSSEWEAAWVEPYNAKDFDQKKDSNQRKSEIKPAAGSGGRSAPLSAAALKVAAKLQVDKKKAAMKKAKQGKDKEDDKQDVKKDTKEDVNGEAPAEKMEDEVPTEKVDDNDEMEVLDEAVEENDEKQEKKKNGQDNHELEKETDE